MSLQRKVLCINGAERSFICDVDKDMLADVLRNLGLTSVKVGCGVGQCGACNVILNGKLVRSCVKKMKSIDDGSTVFTTEGLGTAANLHPLQRAWIIYGGVQCGFCTPGFLISSYALLLENPDPTREEVRAWFQKNKNACRCTGYKPLVDAVMAAAKVMRGDASIDELEYHGPDNQVFNTYYPKPTALGKVLGTTDYGDDISLKVPGMLHLAPVMPPISHGIIKSIDTSEAEKAEGVVKVVTAKDVQGTNRINWPIGSNWADGDGLERPIICDDKVFRLGDVFAVVIADTRRHAREAAKLVTMELDPLPEYLDVLDSVAPDAIEIHPGSPNMLIQKPLYHGEDSRDVFERAPHSVEFSVGTQRQPHLTLEPDTVQAFKDSDGGLTIMLKSHYLHAQKGFIASGIGMSPDKIRLILNPSGGSFGYSFSPGACAIVAACAMTVDQPVSLTFSWREHMLFSGKRSPAYSNARLCCDDNGKLMAGEFDILYDQGCYSESAAVYCVAPLKYFLTPYTCPSARVLARAAYSNTPFNTAYRSPAVPQVYSNTEQMMDMLAEKVGIDPLEFRYINCWKEGDTAIWGEKPNVYVVPGILDKLRPLYQKFKKHAADNTTDKVKYGVGCALGSFNVSTDGDRAEIALELNPDGSVTTYNTWEDMGQGADIGALAITHEALKPLGLRPDQIRLVMNDTKYCPDTGRAAASRSNIMYSLCCGKAATALMDAMRKPDGTYRTYDEMVEENIPTRYSGLQVWPHNEKLDDNTGFGKYPPDQSYAGFVAEVAVDTETGKTDLLEMHCVSDCGVITNWLSVEGQAYGGMLHSIGFALSENYSDMKKHNNMIGAGFPFIETIPDGEHFTIHDNQTPRTYSPFGGTGISEGYQSSDHAAILNAIYQAVGVRVPVQPATPDKLKALIDEKAAGTYQPAEPFLLGPDFNETLDYFKTHPRGEYHGAHVDH